MKIGSHSTRDFLFQRQLALQKIIAQISQKFVLLEDVPVHIQESLESIGLFSLSSRAYIFELREHGTFMDNTYEWVKEGITPEKENLQHLPTNIFPWWMKKLKNHEIISIYDVSRMEEEALEEKKILEAQNIRSALVLPIFLKNKLFGFVGFDNTDTLGTWKEEDEDLLSLVSELFGSIFSRLEDERALKEKNKELHLLLNELKQAESRLIQQEKIIGIGQLAAGIAHEMNTPLGILLSNQTTLNEYLSDFFSYMKDLDSLPELKNHPLYAELNEKYQVEDIFQDTKAILQDMTGGLKKLSNIVQNLRFFSQIDSTEIQTFYNINEGIQSILLLSENKINEQVHLNLSLSDSIPPVFCNPAEINQVIWGLLSNSLDALSHNQENPSIYIETGTHSNSVYLKISDTGVGIPKDILPQIFNPFFSTKEVGNSGLGLSMVYDVIKHKHKGEIQVESQEGKGTSFTVYLPIKVV